MAKRHTHEQQQTMEYLEATFLVRKYVDRRDLAVAQKPDLFHATKPDRHFNRCVDHAKKDLELLYFMFLNLKPRYRLKILQSNELQSFFTQVFDIMPKFNEYNKQEREQVNAFALQMMNFSITMLVRTLPPEFVRSFNNLAHPLNDLIEAIYENAIKNNKDIPRFYKLELPIA